MCPYLKVNAYVSIHEGCAIRFRINGPDDVEFSLGSPRNPFEFILQREALRHFLILGSEALCEMDALRELT